MSVAAWTINIRLHTNSSNVSLGFSRMGSAAAGAEKNVTKLNRSLSALKTVGLAGLVAVGLAAGETFSTGVKGAAALQDAMVNAAISTGNLGKTFGATMRNMQQFHTLALKMSMTTAQSVDQSMGLLAIMAASGIKPADLPKMAMPIAKYADVQYLGKDHVSFEDSVKTAVKVSHDLQAFDPKTMTSVLNHLYKVGYSSPDSIQTMFTQLRYFAPKGMNAGIDRDSLINQMAWLDRMGLGAGRGGSGLNMLIKNLQAPRGKVKMGALQDLGIYNKDGTSRFINQKTGYVDLQGAMQYVYSLQQSSIKAGKGAWFNTTLSNAFDTNAANVLGTLASKGGMEQFKRLLDQQKHMPDLDKTQAQLMGTLNNQTKLLVSNFHSLATEIGFTLLPELTKFVGGLANATGKLAMWMHNHPSAAHAAGYGLLGAAGVGTWAAWQMGKEYIAHAAPWILKRGPGRLAAGVLGIGAEGLGLRSALKTLPGAAWRGITGAPGKAVDTIWNSKTFMFGKSIVSGVRDVGTVFELLGKRALVSRAGLGLLAEVVGKVGLRFIPFVGEILMLIDVVKLLGSHAGEVGKYIGIAAAWIIKHGLPMLGNALKDMVVGAVQALGSFIYALFHTGKGGLWGKGGWFSNFGSGFMKGWNYDQPPPKSKVAHAATGGYTRADGLTYLHKNELVVSAPLTRRLDALTRGRSRGDGGRPIIIKFGDINVEGGGSDMQKLPRKIAKEIAYQVAAILGGDMRLDGAGSMIAGAGFSQFELSGGMS